MEKPNLHEILYKVKSGTEDAVLGVWLLAQPVKTVAKL